MKITSPDSAARWPNILILSDLLFSLPISICGAEQPFYMLNVWRSRMERMEKRIDSVGFIQCSPDPCIYMYVCVTDGLCIIALYVDNLIIARKTDKEMKHVKELLQSQFKMTDIEELHYSVRIAITHRFGKFIELQQKQYMYIIMVIEKYNMGDAKVVSTPADPNVRTV